MHAYAFSLTHVGVLRCQTFCAVALLSRFVLMLGPHAHIHPIPRRPWTSCTMPRRARDNVSTGQYPLLSNPTFRRELLRRNNFNSATPHHYNLLPCHPCAHALLSSPQFLFRSLRRHSSFCWSVCEFVRSRFRVVLACVVHFFVWVFV